MSLRKDVEEFEWFLLLQQRRQILGFEEQLGILLVAGLEVVDDFLDVELVVALAQCLEGFFRLKGATAAAADVVTAKERALGARKSWRNCALPAVPFYLNTKASS